MLTQLKLKQKSRFYIVVFIIIALGLIGLKTDVYAQKKAVNTKKATIQTTLKDKKGYSLLKLSIKNKKKGYYIRYTIDGKNPTSTSKKYNKPIKIKKTTTVKAQIFKGKKKVTKIKKIKIKVKEKADISMDNGKNEKWLLKQYSDQTGSQAMFYTLRSPTGFFVVIDGGTTGNSTYVRQVINENGGKVDVWFLTHPHPDHIGAFNEIYADPQGIMIKQIYDTPMDLQYYDSVDYEWDGIEYYKRYLQLTANAPNVSHLYVGDVLHLEDFQVKVLNSYNDELKYISKDIGNDAGLMLKFSGKKDTLLFCADVHSKAVGERLIQRWGTELQSEYVQLGHHGNGSFPAEFYDYINPQVALFDAPAWLVYGEQFTTLELMKHLQARQIAVVDFTSAPNSFLIE